MQSATVSEIEIPDPAVETPEMEDSEAVCIAYIGEDGEFLYQDSLEIPTDSKEIAQAQLLRKDLSEVHGELSKKFHQSSRQSRVELGDGSLSVGLSNVDIVEPPYPPKCLANFLEVDPVFFRAVRAKSLDSVGREILFRSTLPIKSKDTKSDEPTISASQYRKDREKIEQFMANCNEVLGFRSVLERAAMDYEGIGWAAIEVIRTRDGRIKYLEHVPAQRIRVLKGFKGFVEIVSDVVTTNGQYRFYQPFGQKFRIPADKGSEMFDPTRHKFEDLEDNFIHYQTGEPTTDFSQSANEILYIPKNHSNTIYYGYSDILPALGALVANVHIRDYILQFFEHNTIPRYAVIVKGAKIDENFKKMIVQYFHEHIKGQNHKTLVLTLQGMGHKELDIEFVPLDVSQKEADFLTTRKENGNLIMIAMGTSPAILGIAESAELGSGKGLSQAEIYKDRIVTPCQRYWAEKLNWLFGRGLGVRYAKVDFDPLDIRDMLLEMQYYTGLQTSGVMSINEVRREGGIGGAIPGGDTHFVRIKEGSAYKVSDLPQMELPKPEPADKKDDKEDAPPKEPKVPEQS